MTGANEGFLEEMHTSECGGGEAASVWAECLFSMRSFKSRHFSWRYLHLYLLQGVSGMLSRLSGRKPKEAWSVAKVRGGSGGLAPALVG